jgi:hypothetical protein
MSKQKLNLVQLATGLMAEPGASSPEIVRSKFLDAGFSYINGQPTVNTFSILPVGVRPGRNRQDSIVLSPRLALPLPIRRSRRN